MAMPWGQAACVHGSGRAAGVLLQGRAEGHYALVGAAPLAPSSHVTGLQSSPSGTLLPVTARCHAGEGQKIMFSQFSVRRKHQPLFQQVISK